MHENILTSISTMIRLKKLEEDAFLSNLEFKKFKKNDLILQEGHVCKFIMYIEVGCVRYFHIRDGEEITGQFFLENNWFTDFESFISRKPSNISIQALEDCAIFIIPKEKLEKLYVDFPVFERFGRLMAEQAFLGLRQRNKISTLLTPEERYQSFLKNRPDIVQRVAQHYIASYLGLKPQSLSRIRKRIFDKK